MNILRIKKLIFLHLQHLPMKSRAWRPLVCKWGGVQIISPKRTFIGEGVIFDTNYPQDRRCSFDIGGENSNTFHES